MESQAARDLPPPPPEGELQSSESIQKIKIPSLNTRRAACTHVNMERLYGGFKCHNCDKVSHFDWVYSCTQDEKIPANDVGFETLDVPSPFEPRSTDGMEEVLPSHDMEVQSTNPRLNPWVENAITKGHYTPEQVQLLRAQKRTVIDNTRIILQRFEQNQTSEKNSPRKSKVSQSLNTVPDLPLGTTHNVVQRSDIEKTEYSAPLSAEPKLKMYPHCRYRACHYCRPTYRDRAWQCFDEIFSDDFTIDLDMLEAEERPLASVSLLRTIGLRRAALRVRPRLRSFDSRSIYALNDAGQIILKRDTYRKDSDLPTSTDIADIRVETESKGFRESMKRAFKSMLANRLSKNYPELKRKVKSEARSLTPDLNAVEFDVGLYRELNDELLREAAGTPLPNDSIESINAGMKDLAIGGVAVTEEAAETGTADIILSV